MHLFSKYLLKIIWLINKATFKWAINPFLQEVDLRNFYLHYLGTSNQNYFKFVE